MKPRGTVILFAASILLGLLLAGCGSRQELRVAGRRPLALAVDELGRRRGVMISYEDAASADIGDVERLPGRGTRFKTVLLPASGHLEISDSGVQKGAVVHPAKIARDLIAASEASGNHDRLKVTESNGMTIIAPLASATGRHQVGESVMDKKIDLPVRDWDALSLLRAIAAAGDICFGPASYGELLSRKAERFGAHQQTVRDVLTSALKSLGYNRDGQSDVAYDVLFDKNVNLSFLILRMRPANPPALLCECDASKETKTECQGQCVGVCPDGETTTVQARSNDLAIFNVHVSFPASVARSDLLEIKRTTSDSCSPGAPQPFSTNDTGFALTDDNYQDAIGMDCDMATYYKAYHEKGCEIDIDQQMAINNGRQTYCHYKTNKLVVKITTDDFDTVAISRDTVPSFWTRPAHVPPG